MLRQELALGTAAPVPALQNVPSLGTPAGPGDGSAGPCPVERPQPGDTGWSWGRQRQSLPCGTSPAWGHWLVLAPGANAMAGTEPRWGHGAGPARESGRGQLGEAAFGVRAGGHAWGTGGTVAAVLVQPGGTGAAQTGPAL